MPSERWGRGGGDFLAFRLFCPPSPPFGGALGRVFVQTFGGVALPFCLSVFLCYNCSNDLGFAVQYLSNKRDFSMFEKTFTDVKSGLLVRSRDYGSGLYRSAIPFRQTVTLNAQRSIS